MRARESARSFVGAVALAGVLTLVALAVWPGPEAVMAQDSDGDGLTDAFETAYGTNPQSGDSDGDTLSDFEEIYGTQTDPLSEDSDNDAIWDSEDPDPLGMDENPGGSGNADFSYASNLNPKEARTGTSAVEGVGVTVHNGEFVYHQPLLHTRGRRMDLNLSLTYRSGVTHDGPVGMNWFLFPELRRSGDDVDYYCQGAKSTFEKDQETQDEVTYDSPAGFAGTLVLDKATDEWHLTFPNGYEEIYNADDEDADVPEGGLQSYGFDGRWGVSFALTWDDEQVTTLTDDRGEDCSVASASVHEIVGRIRLSSVAPRWRGVKMRRTRRWRRARPPFRGRLRARPGSSTRGETAARQGAFPRSCGHSPRISASASA